MHKTIEIGGKIYDSTVTLREQFGFGPNTPKKWVDKGLLPQPVRLGGANYFRRDLVEDLLRKGQ